jgi:hypothetical protein
MEIGVVRGLLRPSPHPCIPIVRDCEQKDSCKNGGNTPLCDSSGTCMRAVRPGPSPADVLPDWAAGVSEVSRFSCMKFLGVPGVFDYAGLNKDSRYRPCSCCLPRILTVSASGLYVFAAQ